MKTILCIIMSLVSVTLAGCASNLGVGDEMMQPIYSEEYIYPEQTQHVWRAASSIVGSRIKGRVLVKDSNSHVISWVEPLRKKLDNPDNGANAKSWDEKIRKLKNSETIEVGEGGVAITTVYVSDRNKGSLMRVRRVYYGRLTQPRMVHSRGVFANLFKELVDQRLGKNADNKILSR